MYTTYFEGVRLGIGFGTKPNNATVMPSGLNHEGGFDWGGVEQNGKFVPRVVIKRFYHTMDDGVTADHTKTFLLAYRLKVDGTSCVMATENDVTDNAQMRRLAEAMLKGRECN